MVRAELQDKVLRQKLKRLPEKYTRTVITSFVAPSAKDLRKEIKDRYKELDQGTGEGLMLKSIGTRRRSGTRTRDSHGINVGVRYHPRYNGKTLTIPARAAIFAEGTIEREHGSGKDTGKVKGEGDFVLDTFRKMESRLSRDVRTRINVFTNVALS